MALIHQPPAPASADVTVYRTILPPIGHCLDCLTQNSQRLEASLPSWRPSASHMVPLSAAFTFTAYITRITPIRQHHSVTMRPPVSHHAAAPVPAPVCSSRCNPLQIAGRIKPQAYLHQYCRKPPQRIVTNMLPASPRPLQIVTTVSPKCPKLQFHPINIFSIFQHFFKIPQKSPSQALWPHSQNSKFYTLRNFTPKPQCILICIPSNFRLYQARPAAHTGNHSIRCSTPLLYLHLPWCKHYSRHRYSNRVPRLFLIAASCRNGVRIALRHQCTFFRYVT